MKSFFSVILLIGFFLLSGCSDAKTQTLEMFLNDADIQTIDKVILVDGSTGYSKTMTDSQQIDEFIALIKDILYTPQKNQEERSGWRYGIKVVDGEKEFGFSLMQIGETYYDSEPDIHPIVDAYYQNLDIEEK